MAIIVFKNTGFALGLAASSLIFFQQHVPLSENILNVNLADPLVALSMIICMIFLVRKMRLPTWHVPEFLIFLLIFSIVLIVGLLNGFAKIGVTQWALFSRFIGWGILIGFVIAGSMTIRNNADRNGLGVTLIMACTAASIVIWEASTRLLVSYGLDLGFDITPNFNGFSQNRNAFSYQLIIVLALLIGYSKLRKPYISAALNLIYFPVLVGIIVAGIIWTGSRAGILVTLGMLVICFWRHIGNGKTLVFGVTYALVIWTGVYATASIQLNPPKELGNLEQNHVSNEPNNSKNKVQSTFSNSASNEERLTSFLKGIELWQSSPIFGAGLGVFMAYSPEWFGKPQVIHNTAIWILAELGVLGLIFVVWIGYKTLRFALGTSLANASPAQVSLLLIIGSTTVFSFFHEIFFQRTLWFVVGVLISSPATIFGSRQYDG